MTDWIQVLLGQPWEEPEEDGAETLERGTADISMSGGAGVEEQAGQVDESSSAGERKTGQTPAEEWDVRGRDEQPSSEAGPENSETEEAPLRKASETGGEVALGGKHAGEDGEISAGNRLKTLRQKKWLMWRQTPAEELEGTPARRQAEWAAERIVRQTDGGGGYLKLVLSVPPVQPAGAGQLLNAMSRNDRAATYQTVARQAEREENTAWTGTDPVRLDRIFERDARRYDNGFALY